MISICLEIINYFIIREALSPELIKSSFDFFPVRKSTVSRKADQVCFQTHKSIGLLSGFKVNRLNEHTLTWIISPLSASMSIDVYSRFTSKSVHICL